MIEPIKNILLSPNFWGIVIPALSAVFALLYSKHSEIQSEWRKVKLKRYMQFIESVSGITDNEICIENSKKFAKACNDLHAFSPYPVINCLHKYQEHVAISNTDSTPQQKEDALRDLIWEIRRDLKIRPLTNKNQFRVKLWTSGIRE